MNSSREGQRRQFVSFSFYRVLPEWRRLPRAEREEHRHEFCETVRKWYVPDTMKVLCYSLLGMRADADMLLWRICYSVSCLQEMSSDLMRTRLGGYLETPYSFLGMTRRSEYPIGGADLQHHHELRNTRPGASKYLFVYPLVRTRAWYLLPYEDRQRMIGEIVRLSHDFPNMHSYIVYSYGLDDQDFVIATETDQPESWVERVMRLREAEVSPYTLRDNPNFTCVQTSLEEMLERLG